MWCINEINGILIFFNHDFYATNQKILVFGILFMHFD